jgi:hypothetical protein
MEDEERPNGDMIEADLHLVRRPQQARQATDYPQQPDFSTPSRRRSDDNVSVTCRMMEPCPMESEVMSSSEKNIHGTQPQRTSIGASEGQRLEQRCHHHRTTIKALNSMLSAQENEHQRQIQLKDKELQRRSLEVTNLRETVESYTRQKLILQPQQDLKDSDIAFKYQDLCTAIADWEELQFGHLDNPLETLGQIECSPEEIELLQAYLGVHDGAEIAITHPATGNLMLTCVVHRHFLETILQDDICWPSMHSHHEHFVAYMKRGMKTADPPRGMMTIPSSSAKLSQGR